MSCTVWSLLIQAKQLPDLGWMLSCRIFCEILDTDAVCSLSDLMFPQPLNEPSVVHVAACIVAALDQLHSRSLLFRGLDASTIAVDRNGLAQLVDFRYSANAFMRLMYAAVDMYLASDATNIFVCDYLQLMVAKLLTVSQR